MIPEGQGGAGPQPLACRVTSLQMLARPARAPAPPPLTMRIERVVKPSVAFYRFLYNTVGEDWLWAQRRRWTDERIAATIQYPGVELWLLSVGGQPAGYAELDRRIAGHVELAYFGLMPEVVGRGFGPHLLGFAIHQAWQTSPERVWVHTCTFDHPAALTVYKRAGFEVFKVRDLLVDDPRRQGLIRASAAPHVGLVP